MNPALRNHTGPAPRAADALPGQAIGHDMFTDLFADDVDADVLNLTHTWRTGDRDDAGLRSRCNADLARLRMLWKARPALFSAEALAALKEVSQGIKARAVQLGLPAPRPALGADEVRHVL